MNFFKLKTKRRNVMKSIKAASEQQVNLPYAKMARNIEFVGFSVDDPNYWYWCVSPIYDADNKVHLFCSRWPIGGGMGYWFTKSEIVHFVSDNPENGFKFCEILLSNDNLPNQDMQLSPHNPGIRKVGDKYAMVYIVQDANSKKCNMKTGLIYSDSLYGPWKFGGVNGIVVESSANKNNWTYKSCTGTENPTIAKIGDLYYIFFKSGRGQNANMHYGYATSRNIEGPYTICDEPKMDNIDYIEDATSFEVNGEVFLLTTDNYGTNSGIFGAGILWKMDGGQFKLADAKIAYGVLSDYKDLPNETTYYDNDHSGKLERPGILMKNGKPEYLFGCTRANINGSGKSGCYIFKITDY